MTTFTADDFAKARFATRGNHCASRLAQGQGGPMWTTAGGAEFTDGDMARCGWVPVREANGKREPWADLADKLAVEMPGIEDEPRIEALAKALYCEHDVGHGRARRRNQ